MKSTNQVASTSASAPGPLAQLPNTPLTSSGLVQLSREDGEVELLVANDVIIWDASLHPSVRVSHLIPMITMTSHRLVFHVSKNLKDAPCLHFCHVVRTEASANTFLSLSSSPHILIYSDSMGSSGLVFRHKRDRDTWMTTLDKALERKEWRRDTTSIGRFQDNMTRSVGVDAIISRNQLKHEHAQKVTQEAFQVSTINNGKLKSSSNKALSEQEKQELVEKLFTESRELVSIIHNYIATIENHNQQLKQQHEKMDDAEVNDDPMNLLLDMLNDMGMTTALSKNPQHRSDSSTSSEFYYSTLARQLIDFLQYKNRLKNAGGILSLTDIYCFFNRARGVNTISSQDLLSTCQHVQTLSLGISFKVFPSGVMVLQDDTLMNDDIITQKIYSFLWSKQEKNKNHICSLTLKNAISSMDISKLLGVSPLLAQELLQIVEKAGYICRDYTVERGILYFPNFFVSATQKDCITFKTL